MLIIQLLLIQLLFQFDILQSSKFPFGIILKYMCQSQIIDDLPLSIT
jgi:hypothetical protein